MTTNLQAALNAKSPIMKRTAIADIDYSALSTDVEIVMTSLTAMRTITFTPAGSPTFPKQWIVKDESGQAGSHPIMFATTSGTFDSLTGTGISSAYGSKSFFDNGTNFFMHASFLPSVNASSSIQKADGYGGFKDAIAGTDYATPGSIPAAQVNSDWNSSSGVSQILNKPTIPTQTSQITNNSGFIIASGAPVQSVATRTGAIVLAESDITNLVTDLAKIPKIYFGTALQSSPKLYTNSATVASGVAVFQLTNDGTSTGTALFPGGPQTSSLNAFVSDATASYQVSAVWSNSNKTLTITCNKLTTANILTGILGQSQANGVVVNLTVFGT